MRKKCAFPGVLCQAEPAKSLYLCGFLNFWKFAIFFAFLFSYSQFMVIFAGKTFKIPLFIRLFDSQIFAQF